MTKIPRCTCIVLEGMTGIRDPDCQYCNEIRKILMEGGNVMGEHSGEKKTFRDAIKPPEKFNAKQRVSWYIGLFIGAVLVCACIGMALGLIIGLVRWLTLVWLWLVGA